MQGSIVNQGVELMLFGMGTVLIFLTVLVLAISLMSAVLARYFQAPEVRSETPRSPVPPVALPLDTDATMVAVITAAIHQHRNKKSPNNH